MSLPFESGQRVIASVYAKQNGLFIGSKFVPENGRPRGVVTAVSKTHNWPRKACFGGPCIKVRRDRQKTATWYFCGFWSADRTSDER